MAETALTVLFTSRVGALDRVVSLLRRRGFPVSGMTLEQTHRPEVGRMTLVLSQPAAVDQVQRHLQRLPDVLEVRVAGADDTVRREYALVRIRCAPQRRPEVMALLAAFEARALSMTADHLVLEATGDSASLDALFAELAPYGVEESARTSPIALRRYEAAETERRTA
jgi:acetolactate synthase-1/3 small subunit